MSLATRSWAGATLLCMLAVSVVAVSQNVPAGYANAVCYENTCFSLFPTPHCAGACEPCMPFFCRVCSSPAVRRVLCHQHLQRQQLELRCVVRAWCWPSPPALCARWPLAAW